jgi:hypothetical protein
VNVYLAGPMRGYPGLNHAAFNEAAAALRALGHTVFNPAEHDVAQGIGPDDEAKAETMLRTLLGADLAWITGTADALVMLPGWAASKGALAEFHVARALNIPVQDLDEALEASHD